MAVTHRPLLEQRRQQAMQLRSQEPLQILQQPQHIVQGQRVSQVPQQSQQRVLLAEQQQRQPVATYSQQVQQLQRLPQAATSQPSRLGGAVSPAPSALKGTRQREQRAPAFSDAGASSSALRAKRQQAAAVSFVAVAEGCGGVGGGPTSSASSGGKGYRGDGSLQLAPGSRRPAPEPQLLILKILYLSRIPGAGFFFGKIAYLCSAHVGTEARNDVPTQPGRFTTPAVPPHAPAAVNPEEEVLRQRIKAAIVAMEAEHAAQEATVAAGASASESPLQPPVPETGLECRFNTRLLIKLSEVGPGPAAGGPSYFRIDVWVERGPGMLGGASASQLFGRAFVPLTDPAYQRRPCTWPVVDALGKDLAYLTCDFSFACAPSPVRNLQVEGATATELALSWSPPPHDASSGPLLGYTVEACALPRKLTGHEDDIGGKEIVPALAWQPIGELPALSKPGTVAKNLRGNTRYRFRIRALSEAGAGEAAEAEASTAPVAPGACGRPRLAGCSGPTLKIEWDQPEETGGVPLFAYRVWVRPYSASKADPSEWWETGQVKHREGQVQRAEIRTEELNSSIGRYLCSVAAVNAAGEVGPATSDAAALQFPNPCCVCAPTPQEGPQLTLTNWPESWASAGVSAHAAACPLLVHLSRSDCDGDFLPRRSFYLEQHSGALLCLEPGLERPGYPPPLPNIEDLSDLFGGGEDSCGGLPREDRVVERSSFDWASIPRHDAAAAAASALHRGIPRPPSDYLQRYDRGPAQHDYYDEGFDVDAGYDVGQEAMMRRHELEDLERRLHEKKQVLETSLSRYKEVSDHLAICPEDSYLRRTHEEAEVEAAGFQAEVAVLAQRLNDLNDQGVYEQGDANV